MKRKTDPPFMALKQVFHEPSRMALMASLSTVEDGVSFSDLKEQCALTDGNLNRHLKALEEAGAIRVEKQLYDGRTRTMIQLSDRGREEFVEYLTTLEDILRRTTDTLALEEKFAPLFAMRHIN